MSKAKDDLVFDCIHLYEKTIKSWKIIPNYDKFAVLGPYSSLEDIDFTARISTTDAIQRHDFKSRESALNFINFKAMEAVIEKVKS